MFSSTEDSEESHESNINNKKKCKNNYEVTTNEDDQCTEAIKLAFEKKLHIRKLLV